MIFSLNIFAQSYTDVPTYSRKNAVISASILGMTFITTETFRLKINGNQAAILNISGIVISAGYSLSKTTELGRKVKKYFKLKRNKKTINNYILCEK